MEQLATIAEVHHHEKFLFRLKREVQLHYEWMAQLRQDLTLRFHVAHVIFLFQKLLGDNFHRIDLFIEKTSHSQHFAKGTFSYEMKQPKVTRRN